MAGRSENIRQYIKNKSVNLPLPSIHDFPLIRNLWTPAAHFFSSTTLTDNFAGQIGQLFFEICAFKNKFGVLKYQQNQT